MTTSINVITAINPATEERLAEYEAHDDRAVDAALDSATRAFEVWRELPFGERTRIIRAAGNVLRDRAGEYAMLITQEMGKPIAQSRAEVEKCAWVCDFYADHAEAFLAPEPVESDASESFVRYDPLGPVLAIMPWNFPFWQVFRFAAPALAAGNVGVLKHASNVPGCAIAIEDVFRQAGVPQGAFQSLLITAEQASRLIEDDRIVAATLTGSEGAGRAVGAAAGKAIKPSVLELGGSDAFIILADADIDAALDAAVQSRTMNTGQSCISAKRFIAEASIYDQVVEGMHQRLERAIVGDPLDEATALGPLAKGDLVEDLQAQVSASAARLVTGGHPLDGPGYFYAPTLLADCAPGDVVLREETFGPVAALTRARDADEAVAIANDSSFGLGASVWTTAERGRALSPRIEAGHVAVNGIVKSDPRLPFGGIKRSGYGRELSVPGIRSFVNVKSVWIA